MKHFFPQLESLPIDNSAKNAEGYFRGANVTGVIEKQIGADQFAVQFLIGGAPVMAYMLEGGERMPLPLAEFSSLNNDVAQVRAIQLPDVAGRLALLAMESQKKHNYTVAGSEAWQKQLDEWLLEKWSGLVEITSAKVHGFVLFLHGEAQPFDSIFSSDQGFTNLFPEVDPINDPAWDIVTYQPPASTQAYQCTMLRHGAMSWSRKILCRYKEMVGGKLLQMMDRELNRQIQPWRWNIALEEIEMVDKHFFAYAIDAAHAYRAVFMAMGAQMNIVIGNNLTQKLLSETFEQINPDERAFLQSQRLIPAAFSE